VVPAAASAAHGPYQRASTAQSAVSDLSGLPAFVAKAAAALEVPFWAMSDGLAPSFWRDILRSGATFCVARGWERLDRLHARRVYVSSTLSTMGAEETTTVRVRRPDSERLQSLAKSRQTTVVEVVHSAIEALERQEFLRGLSDDYRRLREDPQRWEAYQDERKEWDLLG
jgi:hypothetical protein